MACKSAFNFHQKRTLVAAYVLHKPCLPRTFLGCANVVDCQSMPLNCEGKVDSVNRFPFFPKVEFDSENISKDLLLILVKPFY